MTRVNTLTEIWDTYNSGVLNEAAPAAKAAKMTTKPGPGPKNLNDKKAGHLANDDTSGPENAEGVMEQPYVVDDPKNKDSKVKKYSDEQYDKKVGKKVKESINNYMKSTFDKLFENVMSDEEHGELEALGVTETETDEASGDEVTITLDKDMAKGLCDLLQAAMGDEDGDEDIDDAEAEDYEMEEFTSDEAEEDTDEEDAEESDDDEEAVEAEDRGHALVGGGVKEGDLKGKKNKVALKTVKKKAEAKIKGQQDAGSELSDGAGHSLTSTKNNKVGNLKVNADLFGD